VAAAQVPAQTHRPVTTRLAVVGIQAALLLAAATLAILLPVAAATLRSPHLGAGMTLRVRRPAAGMVPMILHPPLELGNGAAAPGAVCSGAKAAQLAPWFRSPSSSRDQFHEKTSKIFPFRRRFHIRGTGSGRRPAAHLYRRHPGYSGGSE